jgi:hypothetical protein
MGCLEQAMLDREQAELLHDEISRLPQSFRLPILLCYFEGLTLDEAARQLKWPPGTLRSRLARAREKLRDSLTRRGMMLSGTALATMLDCGPASVGVSSRMCDITARAAVRFAAGQAASATLSGSAAVLAQEVLGGMIIRKLVVMALAVVALGACVAGVGSLGFALGVAGEEPSQRPSIEPPRAAVLKDEPKPAGPGRMFVVGRVLDPNGKPVKGALVDLIGTRNAIPVGVIMASVDMADDQLGLIAQAETDRDGRFRLEPSPASANSFDSRTVLATAPGFGFSREDLYDDQLEADIKLTPERVVRARLVDVRGLPAAGVEVVFGFKSGGDGGLGLWPAHATRAWPKPSVTDKDGRFQINGTGASFSDDWLRLHIRDTRFARQELPLQSLEPKAPNDKPLTLALEPAQIIEGRALTADTHQPISNAIIAVTRTDGQFMTDKFRADAQGRFRINPFAAESYQLAAFPTGGEPYLVRQQQVRFPKGAIKIEHDIELPRGVLLEGKVTDAATGQPLAGSNIQYIPYRAAHREDILCESESSVASNKDGSFQITVTPGKGHLLIFGPTSHYVLEEISSNQLDGLEPGGRRFHAHKIIPYDVKQGTKPALVEAKLRPGLTITGRVVGPNGQKATRGQLLSALEITEDSPLWSASSGQYLTPNGGQFTLNGLAPETRSRLSILDDEHEWGATVEISGKQAGKELIVQLQPCGRAKARFVGPDGKPVVGHFADLQFVATDGPHESSAKAAKGGQFAAEAEDLGNFGLADHGNDRRTDANGQITLPALIPGAHYRINDISTSEDEANGVQVRKDFIVKAGETLELGDILIEKPEQ